MANGETIESYVPARLDRMPWSRWHWLIVVSLGATWILDGLEVTLAGALGGILTLHETLGLTPARVGASATCYLAGAVVGALLFGYGTDRFGRKKLFFITVAVYLIGTALSAFSWNFWSYAFFRAVTGAGIGGEVEQKILGSHATAVAARGYSDAWPTRIRTRTHTPWQEIWDAIVHEHRRRSFLGFVLMLTQAFFYNAIFFTYALVLMRFYK